MSIQLDGYVTYPDQDEGEPPVLAHAGDGGADATASISWDGCWHYSQKQTKATNNEPCGFKYFFLGPEVPADASAAGAADRDNSKPKEEGGGVNVGERVAGGGVQVDSRGTPGASTGVQPTVASETSAAAAAALGTSAPTETASDSTSATHTGDTRLHESPAIDVSSSAGNGTTGSGGSGGGAGGGGAQKKKAPGGAVAGASGSSVEKTVPLSKQITVYGPGGDGKLPSGRWGGYFMVRYGRHNEVKVEETFVLEFGSGKSPRTATSAATASAPAPATAPTSTPAPAPATAPSPVSNVDKPPATPSVTRAAQAGVDATTSIRPGATDRGRTDGAAATAGGGVASATPVVASASPGATAAPATTAGAARSRVATAAMTAAVASTTATAAATAALAAAAAAAGVTLSTASAAPTSTASMPAPAAPARVAAVAAPATVTTAPAAVMAAPMPIAPVVRVSGWGQNKYGEFTLTGGHERATGRLDLTRFYYERPKESSAGRASSNASSRGDGPGSGVSHQKKKRPPVPGAPLPQPPGPSLAERRTKRTRCPRLMADEVVSHGSNSAETGGSGSTRRKASNDTAAGAANGEGGGAGGGGGGSGGGAAVAKTPKPRNRGRDLQMEQGRRARRQAEEAGRQAAASGGDSVGAWGSVYSGTSESVAAELAARAAAGREVANSLAGSDDPVVQVLIGDGVFLSVFFCAAQGGQLYAVFVCLCLVLSDRCCEFQLDLCSFVSPCLLRRCFAGRTCCSYVLPAGSDVSLLQFCILG